MENSLGEKVELEICCGNPRLKYFLVLGQQNVWLDYAFNHFSNCFTTTLINTSKHAFYYHFLVL